MNSTEEEKRITYCKQHNVHHLFELLATKLLLDRPENPFDYLRQLLSSVEDSEKNKKTYDPTVLPSISETKNTTTSSTTTTATTTTKQTLKKITLGTFGIDNAGKTTLISSLGGAIEKNTTPTIGFTPTRFQTDKYDICIFDLGGAANFRGIWVHYFHDCHGIIYVIDSAASEAGVEESLHNLNNLLQHPYTRGKPLLVLTNKKDLKDSRGVKVIPDDFLNNILEPQTPHRIVPSCGIEEDPDLEEGVEWLLATIEEKHDILEAKVRQDTEEVKKENKRKAAERIAALKSAD